MFSQGHINPWWQNEHTAIEYQPATFNNRKDIIKWRSLGYSQKYFIGDTFIVNDKSPAWATSFLTLFKGTCHGVTLLKMRTCDILPYHCDTYKFYKTKYNIVDISIINRVLIFLEDWKPGHIFEIENIPVTQWKSGDYIRWKGSCPHMAANIGTSLRYTAQITFLDV